MRGGGIVGDAVTRMPDLTPREHLVLRLLWEGMTYKQIALALDISEKLVGYSRVRLGAKLGATTGPHLMRRAIEQGLIQV